MNSLELINELYKPYKITKVGSSTILESMDGKFVVKEKGQKDIKKLFTYLHSRDFNNFPDLIDDTRAEVNIYEYIDNVDNPINQKAIDLIRVVANLHSKTSYEKEVREDKYKEIYDNIKNNLLYYKDYYNDLVLKIEENVFMSPSEYLFIRNSSKLLNQVHFCMEKLDNWYESVRAKRSTRVSVIHNDISMEHFLKGKKEALISWDKSCIDSPILDIYKFYQKEALNLEFSCILNEYFKRYELDSEDRELLFILLCIPREIKFDDDEFTSCLNVSEALDYSFKTEYLVRPYYSIEQKE